MLKEINVAEAKKRFSEVMGTVVYGEDEYIITRRGKPMVAIIKPEYLGLIHIQSKEQGKKGLIQIVGKFEDSQKFVEEVERIYSLRGRLKDREVAI